MWCPKCKEPVFSLTDKGEETLAKLGYDDIDVKHSTPPIVCPDCGTKLVKKNEG